MLAKAGGICEIAWAGPIAAIRPQLRQLWCGHTLRYRIEHRPAPRARLQVLVHDDPEAEVDADRIGEDAHEVRVTAGHQQLPHADAQPGADGSELCEVAVGAQGEGRAIQCREALDDGADRRGIPTRTLPRTSPARPLAVRISAAAVEANVSAWGLMSRAISVGIRPRCERRNRSAPTASSNTSTWRATVGWVSPSRRAAPDSEPS